MSFDFESFLLTWSLEPFSARTPPSFHSLCKKTENKDLTDKIVDFPSKESQDCSKIRFEAHNNLILSMQEHIVTLIHSQQFNLRPIATFEFCFAWLHQSNIHNLHNSHLNRLHKHQCVICYKMRLTTIIFSSACNPVYNLHLAFLNIILNLFQGIHIYQHS